MRLMIGGGGTGGHTSPALAVLQELRHRDPRLAVQWVGRRGGIEHRLCRRHEIPFRAVPVEGWPRRRSPRRVLTMAKLGYSTLRCALLIRKFSPQAVLGVGGYVSLPLLLAAQRMGIPTIIHEQNMRLGMANQMLAPRASRIFLSYPDTIGTFPAERTRVSGNPVRSDFLAPPDRSAACAALGLDPARPVVLVAGGSQGAATLNAAVQGIAPNLSPGGPQILWMTGEKAFRACRLAVHDAAGTVQVLPFIENMAAACAAADLVVTRAGASTTAELAVMGKPAILVPFPHATDNHQEANARAFEAAGAALVMLDADCTAGPLWTAVEGLLQSPDRLDAMHRAALTLARPGAAETIVEDLFSILFEDAQNNAD